ncbi:MAG: DUF1580 domain-containing protein [Thermoguttaceae bacterium]
MFDDIPSERPITFNQAAPLLPPDLHPSESTWWRWWRKGVKNIRLRTVMVGGRRYTTAAAIQEFIARVTAAANSEPQPIRTPARRERDIARAERELAGRTTRTQRGSETQPPENKG